MADLEATATDPENLWVLRRKMAKTLSCHERGNPVHRRNLKRQKYAEQDGLCAICGQALPENGRYAELDRLKAHEGYTGENTRHHECHITDKKERDYV
jgi:hypothetical protein